MKKVTEIIIIFSFLILINVKIEAEFINNDKNIIYEKYKVQYCFDDILEENIFVKYELIKTLENGRVYSVKIETDKEIPKERLIIGYFYITKNKIYKINANISRIEKLKNDEIVVKNSSVVYQEKDKKDILRKEELGQHEYIKVDRNEVRYSFYNNKVESGYYESFVWDKKGKLKEYKSGFGAERESIELKAK